MTLTIWILKRYSINAGTSTQVACFTIFQIYSKVAENGSGIQMTQELCKTHAEYVLKEVSDLPDGDAKAVLTRIINYIKQ